MQKLSDGMVTVVLPRPRAARARALRRRNIYVRLGGFGAGLERTFDTILHPQQHMLTHGGRCYSYLGNVKTREETRSC